MVGEWAVILYLLREPQCTGIFNIILDVSVRIFFWGWVGLTFKLVEFSKAEYPP